MSFRLPKKAESWFRPIQEKGSGFELDFDSYYFCLIAGLHKHKKAPPTPNAETKEIIQQFPKEYLPNHRLIIALYLNVHLKSMGVAMQERTQLNQLLTQLISPLSITSLSEEGLKDLNHYAYGGFRALQDFFPEPPSTLDAFLVEFYQFLHSDDHTQD